MVPGATPFATSKVSIVLAVAGLGVVGLTVLDVLRTTVAVDSAGGPVSGKITRVVWDTVLRLAPAGQRRPLRYAGLTIIVGTIALWIALAWLGWALVFQAAPEAVVSSDTGLPAGALTRVYFAGTTLFTLGLGDYRPGGVLWELATVATAGSGLLLVTLAISYLIPVTSAATGKRQLASYVSALGTAPDHIVVQAWNGRDFAGLSGHLVTLAPMLTILAQRHLAYPVLHYFHATERHNAAAPAIAALDEALGLLEHAVPVDRRPEPAALITLRRAIWEFLETLDSTFLDPATAAPPVTSLEPLRAAGIPTVDDDDYRAAMERSQRRRKLLLAMVVDDGYSWDEVVRPETPEHLAPSGSIEEAG